jgi:hypothetical protein
MSSCRQLGLPCHVLCRDLTTPTQNKQSPCAGSTDTSLWTHYKNGAREYCGNSFPDGMRKNQRLAQVGLAGPPCPPLAHTQGHLPRPCGRPIPAPPTPPTPFLQNVITPTTKAEDHDEPITPADIVGRGLMSQQDWDAASAAALRLFAFGQEQAARRGLLLVDTKYEFGRDAEGGWGGGGGGGGRQHTAHSSCNTAAHTTCTQLRVPPTHMLAPTCPAPPSRQHSAD